MWRINGSGEAVDCDLWSNLLQSVCWAGSQGTVSSGLPVNAKGANTTGVIDFSNPSSLVAGTQEDPQAAIDAAVANQTLANQAANLLAVQNLPSPTTCSNSIIQGVCDWIVYAMAAAALVGVVLLGSRR
jgi:hypothetical protein